MILSVHSLVAGLRYSKSLDLRERKDGLVQVTSL